MNSKILKAFAEEIKEQYQCNLNLGMSEEMANIARQECWNVVAQVAKQFNPRFNEAKFRKACGL